MSAPRGAIFPRRATLAEMARSLPRQAIEYSGIIGPGWFTVGGEYPDRAVFEPGIFPWHSHPRGGAIFSPDDLLVFLVSRAPVAALFARGEVAAIAKTPLAWELGDALREIDARNTPPLLKMTRFATRLKERAGDFAAMNEAEASANLGLIIWRSTL